MTNTEVMRKFFYDLPEMIFEKGIITQEVLDAFTPEQMIEFIDGLEMTYSNPADQEAYKGNKAMWKLFYEMGGPGNAIFI